MSNDNIINILDNNTIHNIAAGEIITDKTCILKELIENAIDAKATRIKIILSNKKDEKTNKLIISDNGIGMSRVDSIICTDKYTTSKIKSYKDILFLNSLGFRGEALHSIRTIAKLKILTRSKNASIGTEIYWVNGEVKYIRNVGMPYGTQVEVYDIFHNIPVRKKFLRDHFYENIKIIKFFKSLILPFHKIKFIFYMNGNLYTFNKYELKNDNSTERKNRIKLILKNRKYSEIFILNKDLDNISFISYIAAPLNNIYTKGNTYIYINRRYVLNRELNKAIKLAFSKFIKKFDTYLLICFIEISVNRINPNIHPKKTDVLIEDKKNFYDIIKSIIYNIIKSDNENVNKIKQYDTKLKNKLVKSNENIYNNKIDINLKVIKYIGQVKLTFLLFEYNNKILIIDQHVAAELILFRKIIKRQENIILNMEKNLILVNIKIDLAIEKYLLLYKNINIINKYGIYISFIKENKIIIKKHASFFKNYNIENILENIIEVLEEENNLKDWIFDFIKKIIIKIACYNSLRAGTKINKSEACKLLKELNSLSNNTHCPHGRSISKIIDFKEIFKCFGRNFN